MKLCIISFKHIVIMTLQLAFAIGFVWWFTSMGKVPLKVHWSVLAMWYCLAIYFPVFGKVKLFRCVRLEDGYIEEHFAGRPVKRMKWDSITEVGVGQDYGVHYVYFSKAPLLESETSKRIAHKYACSEQVVIVPLSTHSQEYARIVEKYVYTRKNTELAVPKRCHTAVYWRRYSRAMATTAATVVVWSILNPSMVTWQIGVMFTVLSFALYYSFGRMLGVVNITEEGLSVKNIVPFNRRWSCEWKDIGHCHILTNEKGKQIYIAFSQKDGKICELDRGFPNIKLTSKLGDYITSDCALNISKRIAAIPYDKSVAEWLANNTSLTIMEEKMNIQ